MLYAASAPLMASTFWERCDPAACDQVTGQLAPGGTCGVPQHSCSSPVRPAAQRSGGSRDWRSARIHGSGGTGTLRAHRPLPLRLAGYPAAARGLTGGRVVVKAPFCEAWIVPFGACPARRWRSLPKAFMPRLRNVRHGGGGPARPVATPGRGASRPAATAGPEAAPPLRALAGGRRTERNRLYFCAAPWHLAGRAGHSGGRVRAEN